jgi:hypothetical protein
MDGQSYGGTVRWMDSRMEGRSDGGTVGNNVGISQSSSHPLAAEYDNSSTHAVFFLPRPQVSMDISIVSSNLHLKY